MKARKRGLVSLLFAPGDCLGKRPDQMFSPCVELSSDRPSLSDNADEHHEVIPDPLSYQAGSHWFQEILRVLALNPRSRAASGLTGHPRDAGYSSPCPGLTIQSTSALPIRVNPHDR